MNRRDGARHNNEKRQAHREHDFLRQTDAERQNENRQEYRFWHRYHQIETGPENALRSFVLPEKESHSEREGRHYQEGDYNFEHGITEVGKKARLVQQAP